MIATLGVDTDRTVHLSDVTGGHPGSLAAVVDRSPAPDILADNKELVAGTEEPVASILSAVSRTDVEVDASKREPSGVRRGAFGLFSRCLLGVLGGSLLGMSPKVAGRGGVSSSAMVPMTARLAAAARATVRLRVVPALVEVLVM